HGFSVAVLLLVGLSVAVNRQHQLFGQGVHHRHADAMEAAGNLVGIVVELSTRVQHRHNYFGGGSSLVGMQIHRDATPVIRDGHGLVGMDGYRDDTAVPRQGLVDRVV